MTFSVTRTKSGKIKYAMKKNIEIAKEKVIIFDKVLKKVSMISIPEILGNIFSKKIIIT